MRLLVLLSPEEREKAGVEENLIPLDFDAILKLPFDDVVALEDAMDGGLSLARLRLEMHEYTARHLRGIAYLALWQQGKAPKWTEFKPNPHECYYVVPPEGDAGPPDRASGTSSRKAPARTSTKSARTSRSTTTSRRTR